MIEKNINKEFKKPEILKTLPYSPLYLINDNPPINIANKQQIITYPSPKGFINDNITFDEVEKLVIKYIVFYIMSFIFLIIFWYYLSSFCAVYRNTQSFLIKNTFISFGISLIFPLIYNLFPSVIRIHSFKEKNECFYKFSTVLQIF